VGPTLPLFPATTNATIIATTIACHRNLDNPFIYSDDEADENNNDLLSHLLKDVSEADFDNVHLDTKICDLIASTRK